MTALTRRSVLLGAAALPLSTASADAQAPAVYSSIRVDVSRLHALGAGRTADLLRDILLAELHRLYAGRVGGRGPGLVVRITSLSLTGEPYGPPQVRQSDYLDGELLVVGPRGEILNRVPQLLALPPSGISPINSPQADMQRIGYLAQTYAAWVPRRIG